MSTKIWKYIGSPTLVPSTITLKSYDGIPSQSQRLYQNVPISLERKLSLIDVKVVDAQLNYKFLLGRSFMYTMKVVTSSLFRVIMFPHNRKVVTID